MKRKQKKIGPPQKMTTGWKIMENENGEETEEEKNKKWGKVRWKWRRKEKEEKYGKKTKEDRPDEKK